jgi:hypothetical protein
MEYHGSAQQTLLNAESNKVNEPWFIPR